MASGRSVVGQRGLRGKASAQFAEDEYRNNPLANRGNILRPAIYYMMFVFHDMPLARNGTTGWLPWQLGVTTKRSMVNQKRNHLCPAE